MLLGGRHMGIKSDRRELQGFLYFCIVLVIGNVLISGLAIFDLSVFDNGIASYLIELFGFLKIFWVFIIIVSISKIKGYNSESFSNKVASSLYMIMINVILLAYYLIISKLMDNPLAAHFAFYALFFSIPMTLLWISNKSLESDRRVEWQKACGTYKEYENKNTFLWRYKLDFSNVEKDFTRKDIIDLSNKGTFGVYLIALILVVAYTKGFHPIMILILAKPILYLFDITFALVGSIEGECTGCYRKSRGRSGGSYYYVYIITDYNKKREIKISSNDELLFGEGDPIKVYYALLSKEILKYHPVNYV